MIPNIHLRNRICIDGLNGLVLNSTISYICVLVPSRLTIYWLLTIYDNRARAFSPVRVVWDRQCNSCGRPIAIVSKELAVMSRWLDAIHIVLKWYVALETCMFDVIQKWITPN